MSLHNCRNCKRVIVFNEGTPLEAYKCGVSGKNLMDKTIRPCDDFRVKSKWVIKSHNRRKEFYEFTHLPNM